jgi:hypothetical protein
VTTFSPSRCPIARLIEQVTPLSAISRWNCSLVYWAALIGVMQQRVGPTPPPDRNHQGIGDELRRHRGAHRPADDTAGEEMDDGSPVEPTPPPSRHRWSEIHLRFGAGASKLRSSTLGATAETCRSPESGGRQRRRGRARRACNRINRSIRCSPHVIPAASRSCKSQMHRADRRPCAGIRERRPIRLHLRFE